MSTILFVLLLLVSVAFAMYVVMMNKQRTRSNNTVSGGKGLELKMAAVAMGGSGDVLPSPSGQKGVRDAGGDALPAGWSMARDSTDGSVYFFNVATGKSQWERPTATQSV